MKKLALSSILLTLAGCGDGTQIPMNVFLATVPGAAMPVPAFTGKGCIRQNKETGLCQEWAYKTDRCVNPKGHDANPPIVPCASIKGEDAHE